MSINSRFYSQAQVASSVPFDNTGVNFTSTDVQAALAELRAHPEYDNRSQATVLNTAITLTAADVGLQILTGSATGASVVMPNATTLYSTAIGSIHYKIANTSSQPVTVKDGAGATLFTLSQNSMGDLYLQAQGSAGGTWLWYQTSLNFAAGIISYNVVSNTNFSSSAAVDTLITGMTVVPQAGTYGVWVNYELTGTCAGQQVDNTLYNGASAIADSKRSNLSTSGAHIFSSSTQTIAQFNGTNACALYINPNGNSFTVGARSLLLIRLGP